VRLLFVRALTSSLWALVAQPSKVAPELSDFVEMAEKEELYEDGATNEIDEGWIAAAERAGLGTSIWKEPTDSPENIIIDSKSGFILLLVLPRIGHES